MPTSSEIEVSRLRAISSSMALRSEDAVVMSISFHSEISGGNQIHHRSSSGRDGYKWWYRTGPKLLGHRGRCQREYRRGRKWEYQSIHRLCRPVGAPLEIPQRSQKLPAFAVVERASQ